MQLSNWLPTTWKKLIPLKWFWSKFGHFPLSLYLRVIKEILVFYFKISYYTPFFHRIYDKLMKIWNEIDWIFIYIVLELDMAMLSFKLEWTQVFILFWNEYYSFVTIFWWKHESSSIVLLNYSLYCIYVFKRNPINVVKMVLDIVNQLNWICM